MILKVEIEFQLGEMVYLKANENFAGILTGITLRPNNGIIYHVTWQDSCERTHYDVELSAERFSNANNR